MYDINSTFRTMLAANINSRIELRAIAAATLTTSPPHELRSRQLVPAMW